MFNFAKKTMITGMAVAGVMFMGNAQASIADDFANQSGWSNNAQSMRFTRNIPAVCGIKINKSQGSIALKGEGSEQENYSTLSVYANSEDDIKLNVETVGVSTGIKETLVSYKWLIENQDTGQKSDGDTVDSSEIEVKRFDQVRLHPYYSGSTGELPEGIATIDTVVTIDCD